jgi:hypothetical protein
MILRVEAGRKHATVGANGHGSVLGFADDRQRAAQAAGREGIVEPTQP